MDQRDDYDDDPTQPRRFRYPPAWVLTLLTLFVLGLGLVLIDLITQPMNQLIGDLRQWLAFYGWMVGMTAVLLFLAVGIWRGSRRAIARAKQSGEVHDYVEPRVAPDPR